MSSSKRELLQGIVAELEREIGDLTPREISDEEDAANRAWLEAKRVPDPRPPLPRRIRRLVSNVKFNREEAAQLLEINDPEMIGRFEAVDYIDRGAYGVVFLARDLELKRNVALKLCPHLHPDAVDMFRREAQVLAGFRHENIVTVHDIAEHDGDLFYVMEYLPGGDGQSLINSWQSWEEVVRFFLDAATGLAAAHGKGIIHGDFKLKNILRGINGEVRVADFGLGRLIGNGVPENDPRAESHRMGTVQYMAPEVLRGQQGDALGDQWSFGVALWAVLFAALPFDGKTHADVLESIERDEPNAGKSERPVPSRLRRIALRCMSVDRARRFADMHEVIVALDKLLPPTPNPRAGPTWGPTLLAFILGGGAALSIMDWPGVDQPEAKRAPSELPARDPPQSSFVAHPCTLSPSDGDPSTIDPVVVAVCSHIRRGELDKAQSLWLRERADRKLDRGTRVRMRIHDLEAQQDMDETQLASTAVMIESELAYTLAQDTVIVARTFVDWATRGGPDARAAATHANDWAVEAAATLGGQAPEITDIRDRIGRLSLPQALDFPTLLEDAPLAVE